jgi:hypothetical protein
MQMQVFKHRRHEGAPAQLVVPCETTHDGVAVRQQWQWDAANLHYRTGGGGGGYRQSAYASIPCYLCVALALTVSKVLT